MFLVCPCSFVGFCGPGIFGSRGTPWTAHRAQCDLSLCTLSQHGYGAQCRVVVLMIPIRIVLAMILNRCPSSWSRISSNVSRKISRGPLHAGILGPSLILIFFCFSFASHSLRAPANLVAIGVVFFFAKSLKLHYQAFSSNIFLLNQ